MIRRLVSRPEVLIPVVALGVMLIAFLCAPLTSGRVLTTFDAFNTFQGLAQLGLLTLGLGMTMIAGEFDLSVVGTYALGGMIAVRAGQSSPVLGVLAAVAAGAAIGAAQGGLIARLRIASLVVTLATYITLLGLTSAMSGGLDVTYNNTAATRWIDQPIAVIFATPSLVTLAAFAIVAVIFGGTRLGREIRAVGGDRRASRVAGVRVDRALVGLFTASGTLAALGGALFSYSYATANPNPGFQPLILSAVGCLVGGVSLAGGRGLPAGLLAGALSVALLGQIDAITAIPDYFTELLYAALLGFIVAIDAPGLRRGLDRLKAHALTTRLPDRHQ
jgi:ribose/xylose/arabinose/galactoside ABC-type transport system permease subunit